jgi:hypothetical protein
MPESNIPITFSGPVSIVVPVTQTIVESSAAKVLRDTLLRRGIAPVQIVSSYPNSIASRTGISIYLGVDANAEGMPSASEAFLVRVTEFAHTPPAASIIGSDSNGLLYGIGRFLRELSWPGNGRFSCPALAIADAPDARIRGWCLANHPQTTSYDKWELSDWDEYLREAALWGVNTLVVYPMHASRWKGVNPWSVPPQWESDTVREEWQRQWAIQKVVPLLARDYRMKYGIWNPVNDIFPLQHRTLREQGHSLSRNEDKDRGPLLCNRFDYVCPSIPESRQAITELRRHVFSELAHVDFIFLPSGDDGGCPCPECAPWAKTYIELVEEQSDLVREYHPNAELWVSNQKLPSNETTILLDYLRGPTRPAHLTAFCNGPFSGGKEFADTGLSQVAAALEGVCDVVLYPDTTHMTRCQFPIPDVDPEIVRLFRREDGPFARPNGYRHIFAENAAYSVGSILYSEGIHDAMNKVLWAQWEWDREKSTAAAVQDYCRWYFGEETLGQITAAVFQKERNWSLPVAGNAGIGDVCEAIASADKKIPDILRQGNWRWNLHRMEALLFDFAQNPSDELKHTLLQLRDTIYQQCRLTVRGCDRL